MTTKQRLSASVDQDVLAAVERAVRAGQAPSVSAWVTDALRAKLAHEQRLAALGAYLADYEREFGAFTEDELRAVEREARARAVRTGPKTRRAPATRRRAR